MSDLIAPSVVVGGGGLLTPVWISKNCGGELWFANDETHEYCGKKLLLVRGRRNSWHYHKTKDEVFLIDSGRMQLIYSPVNRGLLQDDIGLAEKIILHPGQAFHVPATMRHQMVGIETCWLIEASTVDLPGDTVRLIKGD